MTAWYFPIANNPVPVEIVSIGKEKSIARRRGAVMEIENSMLAKSDSDAILMAQENIEFWQERKKIWPGAAHQQFTDDDEMIKKYQTFISYLMQVSGAAG